MDRRPAALSLEARTLPALAVVSSSGETGVPPSPFGSRAPARMASLRRIFQSEDLRQSPKSRWGLLGFLAQAGRPRKAAASPSWKQVGDRTPPPKSPWARQFREQYRAAVPAGRP